jgi:60S ribosomal protein L4 C-terminal domain
MANSDLARLINSDEIQSVVNAPKTPKLGKTLKKNPLKNLGAMLKLNPYAKTIRRQELSMAVRPSAPFVSTTQNPSMVHEFMHSNTRQYISMPAVSLKSSILLM